MISTRNLAGILLVAAACAALAGCGRGDERDELSAANVLYEQGHAALQGGDFRKALRFLGTLKARFPFNPQTRQAQLEIIYCHYRLNDQDSAVEAAREFERENPRHPNVDYAIYMRGLALFARQPGRFGRLFRIDYSRRPVLTAGESFDAFMQLTTRYPESEYAADARRRMVYLRNRMARYENHVADYYLRRGAWIAAANHPRGGDGKKQGYPDGGG
ncbi:MAG: outer membrane protein assembly factor BamD [Gammaproteobacteria bacterium]|nr:outer membrane protein assembly factor BamD [Gammaproteobacteria bacterium]